MIESEFDALTLKFIQFRRLQKELADKQIGNMPAFDNDGGAAIGQSVAATINCIAFALLHLTRQGYITFQATGKSRFIGTVKLHA